MELDPDQVPGSAAVTYCETMGWTLPVVHDSKGGGLQVSETSMAHGRRQELWAFLVLTVLLAPILSVAVVGGYGFLIWMAQLLIGPPSS